MVSLREKVSRMNKENKELRERIESFEVVVAHYKNSVNCNFYCKHSFCNLLQTHLQCMRIGMITFEFMEYNPLQKEKTAPSQSPNELKDERDRLKKDNEKLKKDLKERKNVSDIHPLKTFVIDYSV